MKLHTYDEWQDLDYQVQWGSKHIRRNEKDEPLFSQKQVEKISRHPGGPVSVEYQPWWKHKLRS